MPHHCKLIPAGQIEPGDRILGRHNAGPDGLLVIGVAESDLGDFIEIHYDNGIVDNFAPTVPLDVAY